MTRPANTLAYVRAVCAHLGIDTEVVIDDHGRNVLVDPAGLERLRDRCAARGDTEAVAKIDRLLDADTDP